MFSEDIRKQLAAPLPQSAIKSRQGGGNQQLDYVDGHHVKSELNRIFGAGGWNLSSLEVLERGAEKVGDKHEVHVVLRGRVVIGTEFTHTDVGFGSGKDKSLGAAWEKAYKEAATDTLKRCVHSLGNTFGLALYDKERKDVTDDFPVGEACTAIVEQYAKALTQEQWRDAQQATSKGWVSFNTTERGALTAASEQSKTRIKETKK